MIQRRSGCAACAMSGKCTLLVDIPGETVLQTVEMYIPEMDIWTETHHILGFGMLRIQISCRSLVDLMVTNRLNSVKSYDWKYHTVNVGTSTITQELQNGNYFYAIGGYNTSVIKTVIRLTEEMGREFTIYQYHVNATCRTFNNPA
ncbi:hypothetical protein DINM_020591 [Dirofilaria immitis]|nr:hypothetical protein [Dirofilaria immitis]